LSLDPESAAISTEHFAHVAEPSCSSKQEHPAVSKEAQRIMAQKSIVGFLLIVLFFSLLLVRELVDFGQTHVYSLSGLNKLSAFNNSNLSI
jgi:hypothetical protein